MIQPGDTVRYLNSVGGGIVRRVDGKIAYVEDDGFETPYPVKELVVVLPAGHEKPQGGAKLMFDQKAFDAGKAESRKTSTGPLTDKDLSADDAAKAGKPGIEGALPPTPAEETPHGDRLTLALAFEPSNLKKLSESTFNAVLVNDSNYMLQFMLAGRSPESAAWNVIYQGDVQPNELIDLAQFSHSTLGRIERIVFQAIAFKESKPFEIKDPITISRKLDLTKFHKFHCFRPDRYFETPVLSYPLVNADRTV